MNKEQLISKLIQVDRITEKLNQAEAVVCMSKILRSACLQVGVREQKLHVLGNRVFTDRFKIKEVGHYDPSIIRGLFIGRLEEQKNVHGVTKALAILKRKDWKVHLTICGGKKSNEYLEASCSELEPAEWTYKGSVPNKLLPDVYAETDMYIGPSFFEGFQIPLIEALACGVPCVVSDQAPANEIISEQVGELIEPDNPESIAAGIERLKQRLQNPEDRKTIRELCRKQAMERWDYYQVSSHEVDIYSQAYQNFDSPNGKTPKNPKGKGNI